MARHSTFLLYDRLSKGRASALITNCRTSDPPISYEEIALRLRDLDIQVTGETVRRWWSDHLAPAAPELDGAA